MTPKLAFLNKFPPILSDVLVSWYYRYKIFINRVWGGRAFYYSMANPNSDALQVVGEMIDKGEIKPLIDAVYSLDEIVAAHQHVEEGHTRIGCGVWNEGLHLEWELDQHMQDGTSHWLMGHGPYHHRT